MIIFHGYSLLQVSNILNQTPAIPGIEVLAGIGMILVLKVPLPQVHIGNES